MKLWAISDLHVGYPDNRAAIAAIAPHPDDWLILGGDLGESAEQVAWTLDTLGPRFAQLIWVPGNHELWTRPLRTGKRGVAKYEELVALCRARGVLTPEDPYPLWRGEGGAHRLAPLFLLYDYSFRPDDVPEDRALEWAMEEHVLCTDEYVLHPDPHESRSAWCHARCELSEARLSEALTLDDAPLVLINHFPLRRDHAVLPRVPRFSIWCGTRRTQDWHRRFRAAVVVYGHLHIPGTRWLDGVRFEEVSFGYPSQRRRPREMLRQILPEPARGGG